MSKSNSTLLTGSIIIFAIIISAAFANVYNDVTNADDLKSIAGEFTLMPFIMKNFPKFILTLSFLIIIALYAKQRNE